MSIEKSIQYINDLLASGKKSLFLESVVDKQSFELEYLEYFLTNLSSLTNGKDKIKQAIDDIPSDEVLDMTHHHWRSFMSEFTAYWILETKLGYTIDGFDILSPYRKREKANCDAICKNVNSTEYIEIKSAHDWTRYSAPRSIVNICKSTTGYRFIISINLPKFETTDNVLKHIKDEIEVGKEYLNSEIVEASYSIYSQDNHWPHDVEILIKKNVDMITPNIIFGFQPRKDEDLPNWLKYRLDEANEKGATILFVNYIFWIEPGTKISIADILQQHLPNLKKSINGFSLSIKAVCSVKRVFVFMPSGIFESINIESMETPQ